VQREALQHLSALQHVRTHEELADAGRGECDIHQLARVRIAATTAAEFLEDHVAASQRAREQFQLVESDVARHEAEFEWLIGVGCVGDRRLLGVTLGVRKETE
jgi:hypothetical protein